ncbi:hypothetical protein [Bdellovibrio sp. HCB209]|uniref:hypothetical protein n=1 Tax=Bdellovibrio sp. HCB209 TaxID=3394354 RepID=UPI0039B3F799
MKSLSVVVMGCLLSVASFAAPTSNRVVEKADRVAMELRYRGHQLSQEQLEKINKNLDSIRFILDGDLDESGSLSLSCVPRDNDGRPPYTLAAREGVQTFQLGAIYGTAQDCDQALKSARVIGNKTFVCSSKDNDGREPTIMAVIAGKQLTKIAGSVMTKGDCNENLRLMKADRGGNVALCGSRDSDSRAPFIAISVNVNNGSIQKSNTTFSNITECRRFIGQ